MVILTFICRIWLHELFFPIYASALSLLILVIQSIVAVFRTPGNNDDEPPSENLTLGERFKHHLEGAGGRVIFTCRLARLVAVAALVSLSVYTVLDEIYTQEEHAYWLQIGLLAVYVSPRTSRHSQTSNAHFST